MPNPRSDREIGKDSPLPASANSLRSPPSRSTVPCMLSVDEALREILERVSPLNPENVSLAEAMNRVLREDVRADTDLPPFNRSSMDGYAIPPEPAKGKTFRVVREVQAGDEAGEPLAAGECARIFTGAPVPVDARVIRQEEVTTSDGTATIVSDDGRTNVRRQGEDARRDEVLVPMAQRLNAAALGILASVGHVRPLVTQAPRVAHLSTGNEIVPPDQQPIGAQIRDSNSALIAGLLSGTGARIVRQCHVEDRVEELINTTRRLLGDGADVLLFSGGASVGAYDFTRQALEETGFTVHFDKVSVRPGKPLIFATRGRQVAFGIPGNPVSHFATFHLFIAPALAALAGVPAEPERLSGHLLEDLTDCTNPRETYWPALWEAKPHGLQLRALPWSSSGHLSALAYANALLHVPANSPDLKAGATVKWLPV